MSRDSKIADYADGQFVVASLRGIGPLYYSMDSGESFYDFRKSSGEKDWVAGCKLRGRENHCRC